MWNAAERCRQAFRIAHMDPLRAIDLSRVPTGKGRGRDLDYPTRARNYVRSSLELLGGQRSLVSSCLYHVIGLEWSVRRWAREHAGIPHTNAGGVLLAALVILAAKQGGRRSAA